MRLDESYRYLNLKYAYQIASIASEIITSENIEDRFNQYLWFFDKDHKQYFSELVQLNEDKILKPNKESILYDFISELLVMILTKHEYWFLDDYYNWCHEEIELYILQHFIEPLEAYNPIINKYRKKLVDLSCLSHINRNQYEEKVKEAISEIINLFIEGKKAVIDETFYLLFNDKHFLFHFNELLSKFIMKSIKVKRVVVPSWLKKGIFFRDNGRCQECLRDLSGIVSITPVKGIHFDHIIALERGGSNDPTNFQLLCSNCNLKKSTKSKKSKILYQFYW
ncbi:HNH endonuclease [Paenibacillus peoriae]|uniref:HNH endonuclease n=1 Tax=Paenibacillus peoriae TaxID=59893 RepID=UPI00096C9580|nr:HNH endonuclease signature motif containing protein [Paenibacillus peoriae]OMF80385.1 hypothetical protein BK145_08765 [Paenibacillus peoriae]